MNWKFFQRRILIVVSFLGLCSFVAGQVGQSTEPALSFDKSTLNTDQQFSASDSSVPDITGWWFALNRTSIFGDAMADGNYLLRLVIQTTNDGKGIYSTAFGSRSRSPEEISYSDKAAVKQLDFTPGSHFFLKAKPRWDKIKELSLRLRFRLAENGLRSVLEPDEATKSLFAWMKEVDTFKDWTDDKLYQAFELDWRRTDPRKTIETEDLIIAETATGLAAFSKSLGKWSGLSIGLTDDGRTRLEHTTVGTNFAAATFVDSVFGYCSRIGKWDKLEIPKEYQGKVAPVVGMTSLNARFGDRTYTLSQTTGEWSSADDQIETSTIDQKGLRSHTVRNRSNQDFGDQGIARASISSQMNDVISRDVESAPGANRDRTTTRSNEASSLTNEITLHESQAAMMASQVRTLISQVGKDDQRVVDARRELNRKLDAALELRFQREELQVKEQLARLSRLQQQIGQRKAQRTTIVERRTAELIEGEGLKWDNSGVDPQLISRNHRTQNLDLPNEEAIKRQTSEPVGESRNQTGNVDVTNGANQLQVVQTNIKAEPREVTLRRVANRSIAWSGSDLERLEKELRSARDLVLNYQRQLTEHKQGKSQTRFAKGLQPSLESLEMQLADAKRTQTILQKLLTNAKRDLELEIRSAELDIVPYEELSRRAEVGQLIPRKDLIENKVRAEKAKLTIESLQGQLELFNELSKGLIKDETTEQDPKTEPSKSITPDQ